jgi:hypothetical protein
VGLRAGPDVEKRKFLTLPGLGLRPLGRPVRSQSLYRLRYSNSLLIQVQSELFLTNLLFLLAYFPCMYMRSQYELWNEMIDLMTFDMDITPLETILR